MSVGALQIHLIKSSSCIYAINHNSNINPKGREEAQRHVQISVCPPLCSLLSELHLGANAALRRPLQHPCAQMDQNKCPPGRPQPVLPEPTLRLHSEPLKRKIDKTKYLKSGRNLRGNTALPPHSPILQKLTLRTSRYVFPCVILVFG